MIDCTACWCALGFKGALLRDLTRDLKGKRYLPQRELLFVSNFHTQFIVFC